MSNVSPWSPSAEPPGLSDIAQLLTRLSQMIPAGEWMTYGDLADASNVVDSDSKTSARGVASALSYLPPETSVHDWPVPWHRIRLENGHLKSRIGGEKVDPADPLNKLFAAEGGRLIGGAALQGRRFPMAAKLRQGHMVEPS